MFNVRYAVNDDFAWLDESDNHVNSDWIKRCLSHKEYVIAVENDKRLGFLRFSYFWGDIPYMDLIRVNKDRRRQGIGTAMFQFWESEMKNRDTKVLMTSSTFGENEPKTWHERNGFVQSGELIFGIHEPVPEVFFIKNLV